MTKDYAFDKSSREGVLSLRELLAKQYPKAKLSVNFKGGTVNLHVETNDEDVGKAIVADVAAAIGDEKSSQDATFDSMFDQYMAFRESSGEENAKEALHSAADDAGIILDEDAGVDDWIEAILKEGGDPSAYFNADSYGPLEDEDYEVFDNIATIERAREEGWSEEGIAAAITKAAKDANFEDVDNENLEHGADELGDAGVDLAPYLTAENRSDYGEGEDTGVSGYDSAIAELVMSGADEGYNALTVGDFRERAQRIAATYDEPFEKVWKDFEDGLDESGEPPASKKPGGKDAETDALVAKAKKAIAQPSLVDQIKKLPPEERKALLKQLSEDVPVDAQERIKASPKQQSNALAKLIGRFRF